MSYTNAQVVALIKAQNAALARIERALVAAPAAVPTSTTVAPAAAEVAIPVERAPKSAKVACSKHADHKGGRGFSPAGMAAHRVWCVDGVTSEVAPAS